MPRIVSLAILTLFFVQGVQQFFLSIYWRSFDALSIDPSAMLAVLFLSPLAYLPFGKVDTTRLVLLLGAAVVVLRIMLAVPIGPDGTLLLSGLTVATYLLYLPAYLLRGGASAGLNAAGFALGFAGDAVARAAYFGSDPFAAPWGVVLLAVVAGVALLSLVHDPGDELGVAPPISKGMRGTGFVRFVLLGLGLGATHPLQATLLNYPFVFARFVTPSHFVVTLAVFVGLGLGMWVVARGVHPSTAVHVLGNAVLVGAIIDLAWIASPILPVVLGIAQVTIIVNLAILFQYLCRGATTLRVAGFVFGVAGAAFVTCVFAFAFPLTLAYAFVPGRSPWEGRLPLLLAFTALAAIPPILLAWWSRVHGIRVERAPGEARRVLSGAFAVLFVMATLGSLVTPVPSTSGLPSSIVVMTYNIHQGFGLDGYLGIDRIAEVIRQANADIVALQESDTVRIPTGSQDAVRFFAGSHGVSILSRFPILRWDTIFLPGLEIPGVMIEADVQIGSQVIRVYATHFGLTLAERTLQAAFVREMTATAPFPKILLGDFNSLPRERRPGGGSEDPYIELMGDWRDSWTAAGHSLRASDGFTWPASSPIFRIDYVFLGPGIGVDSVEVPRNSLTVLASDHLPVIARILLP